jgi:hypothetical protein
MRSFSIPTLIREALGAEHVDGTVSKLRAVGITTPHLLITAARREGEWGTLSKAGLTQLIVTAIVDYIETEQLVVGSSLNDKSLRLGHVEKKTLHFLAASVVALTVVNYFFAWAGYWSAFGYVSATVSVSAAAWLLDLLARMEPMHAPVSSRAALRNLNGMRDVLLCSGIVTLIASFVCLAQAIYWFMGQPACVDRPQWNGTWCYPGLWGGLSVTAFVLYLAQACVSLALAGHLGDVVFTVLLNVSSGARDISDVGRGIPMISGVGHGGVPKKLPEDEERAVAMVGA